MPYEFYKILHIVGVILTVYGLFGLSSVLWAEAEPKPVQRRVWAISHGLGLLIVLVAGFGLAARLGYFGQLPGWVYAKLAVWFLVGAMLMPVKRRPKYSAVWIVMIFILVSLGAGLAVTKAL